MPPISPEVHEELGKRLRQSREVTMAAVRSRTDAEPGDLPAISPAAHIGQADDMSTGETISHDAQHRADHDSALLHEIDAALGRLESGGIGICVECGRDIPEARLLATPTVQTCVPCQERLEKAQGTGRGPTM
jgi:DnaK suppressor protein